MKQGQIFGITTYDALFKWVLSVDTIRASFFHAFLPHIIVRSSERLDDHMNPLQDLQLLRAIINDKETTTLVKSIKKKGQKAEVYLANSYHEKATKFLQHVLHHFDDIRYSFPQAPFNGAMDFVCQLDTGEYALVEMQVVPEDKWDQRALAYIASFYGSQLRRKSAWKEIQKVIGVNILGGGRNEEKHWKDTPNQYVRYYKFQEQLHAENPPRILEGIDIIQYSLANVPKNIDSQEQKDWLQFFKDAHTMTEEDVQREIKTAAVLEAFERAKLLSLPEIVRSNYDKQEVLYERISDYVSDKMAEGKAEGIAEGKVEGEAEKAKKIAKRMIKKGESVERVCEITELPSEIVQQLLIEEELITHLDERA